MVIENEISFWNVKKEAVESESLPTQKIKYLGKIINTLTTLQFWGCKKIQVKSLFPLPLTTST